MIINFSVQNFGCIKDKVTLSFEATKDQHLEEYYCVDIPNRKYRLLKLGFIFGANASGKTTVLKALDFLRTIIIAPLDQKDLRLNYIPFLFDEQTVNQPSYFSIEFIYGDIPFLYEVVFNSQAVLGENLYFYKPNKALVYNRVTDIEKQLSSISFGNKIKIKKAAKEQLEANTLWNNTVLGSFLKTNIESEILQDAVDWFRNHLSFLITPNTNLLPYISTRLENGSINKNSLVYFLSKADFNISDIIIEQKELPLTDELAKFLKESPLPSGGINKLLNQSKIKTSDLFFQHTVNQQQKFHLNYYDESQGTQRYYQFSGLLDLIIRNGLIVPIDELESSLHPELLEHFLRTFLANAQDSQLIVTTHQRELLMEKGLIRQDSIWFTEKLEDGSTDLFSLTDFDSSVVRNTSSIYNAYKIGKLGAVPNLQDYHVNLEDE